MERVAAGIVVLMGATACGRVAYDAIPTDGSVVGSMDARVQVDAVSDARFIDTATDSGTDAEATAGAPCPASLPSEWIFCDDFESGSLERYAEVSSFGPPRIVTTEAVSGDRSLELQWDAGENEPGWVWLWFGRSPLDSRMRMTEDFTDLYIRMRVKMDASWAWTGDGVGLVRVTSFAAVDWTQAFVGVVGASNGPMQARAWSCVESGAVTCLGFGDFDHLRVVREGASTASLVPGRWQCVEMHLRLNTPGAVDGTYQVRLDGLIETDLSGVDWRGTWDTYGINGVSFYGWWEGTGPTTGTRRWLDDIVIATVPVGC